jgi:uncharacterized protein
MNLQLPVINLPSMRCDDGCGECCGPVHCRQDEFDRIVAYAAENGITPKRQGLRCPFFQGGKCSVHPVRPFICRLFGHSQQMVCPRGYSVLINPKKEEKIMREYRQGGRTDIWLHTAVYAREDLEAMLARVGVKLPRTF